MAHRYTLAEIRDGTGFPDNAQFLLIGNYGEPKGEGTPCPNCAQNHAQLDGDSPCLLQMCIWHLVSERGELTVEEATLLLPRINADAFWDALGPVIDRLRDGDFNEEGEVPRDGLTPGQRRIQQVADQD